MFVKRVWKLLEITYLLTLCELRMAYNIQTHTHNHEVTVDWDLKFVSYQSSLKELRLVGGLYIATNPRNGGKGQHVLRKLASDLGKGYQHTAGQKRSAFVFITE